jgi:transcription elongation factor Elf1
MNCPRCNGRAEQVVFFEDPLPGIVGDQIKVTVLLCDLCGPVDREAEMVVPLPA